LKIKQQREQWCTLDVRRVKKKGKKLKQTPPTIW
jgi:hypothetical protein